MDIHLVWWDCQFVSDLIYIVHGQTSQLQDCPTPIEFMGIHLIHGITKHLWTWTHNSSMGFSKFDWFAGIHLTYEIIQNCMKFNHWIEVFIWFIMYLKYQYLFFFYCPLINISTTRFPNSYRVHGHTSHSWDSPTFKNTDTQLLHMFV